MGSSNRAAQERGLCPLLEILAAQLPSGVVLGESIACVAPATLLDGAERLPAWTRWWARSSRSLARRVRGGQCRGSVSGMTVELPETIPGVVKRAAEVFGDREAIVDGDVRLTFAELAERVERAAGAFIGSGIEPGDRVDLGAERLGVGRREVLGLHTAGAVLVPLNTRFKERRPATCSRSRVLALFTVTDFLDTDYVALLEGVEGLDALRRR